jgi:hypothetical protein
MVAEEAIGFLGIDDQLYGLIQLGDVISDVARRRAHGTDPATGLVKPPSLTVTLSAQYPSAVPDQVR